MSLLLLHSCHSKSFSVIFNFNSSNSLLQWLQKDIWFTMLIQERWMHIVKMCTLINLLALHHRILILFNLCIDVTSPSDFFWIVSFVILKIKVLKTSGIFNFSMTVIFNWHIVSRVDIFLKFRKRFYLHCVFRQTGLTVLNPKCLEENLYFL